MCFVAETRCFHHLCLSVFLQYTVCAVTEDCGKSGWRSGKMWKYLSTMSSLCEMCLNCPKQPVVDTWPWVKSCRLICVPESFLWLVSPQDPVLPGSHADLGSIRIDFVVFFFYMNTHALNPSRHSYPTSPPASNQIPTSSLLFTSLTLPLPSNRPRYTPGMANWAFLNI